MPKNGTKWRLAIVVQRYGEEVNGGAEQQARWLAERLTALGTVEVITTCALDYTTWADHYPPGETEINGIKVHRFPVDAPRNWRRAQKETGRLLIRQHSIFDEMQWMRDQGPYSTPLFEFLRRRYADFDYFIFFTYLYGHAFFGLPLVSDKAILVPEAHDDPFITMPVFRPLFHLPRAIVYNTLPEKELVNHNTQNDAVRQIIAANGITEPGTAAGERFRQKYGIDGPFLLYVGRIHESKNVPELFDHFLEYRAGDERPIKLILIGKSHLTIPDHPDIIHLGFLPEQDKFDALRAATLLVMPSIYESLSIIIMEAWLMGTPVLVNGRCAVLKHQCQQSNGGLYYYSYDEFEAALPLLLDSPALRIRLGQNGREFVRRVYDWDVVIAKYRQLLQDLDAE